MNIVLSNDEFEFINKKVIAPLKKFELDIFIFGSRATLENNKFSDLDLLIKTYRENTEIKKQLRKSKKS